MYIYEPRFEMTAEIRDRVRDDLAEQFPHVQFRAHSWNSEHHSIVISDSDFFDSKECLLFLGELEKKYAPDYDIFHIGFSFMEFDRLDKYLNEHKNRAKSVQAPRPADTSTRVITNSKRAWSKALLRIHILPKPARVHKIFSKKQ